jgi:hypothetical protein
MNYDLARRFYAWRFILMSLISECFDLLVYSVSFIYKTVCVPEEESCGFQNVMQVCTLWYFQTMEKSTYLMAVCYKLLLLSRNFVVYCTTCQLQIRHVMANTTGMTEVKTRKNSTNVLFNQKF